MTLNTTSYGSFSAIGERERGTSGLGNAGQIVVYTITYPWHLFTPMVENLSATEGNINLRAYIVVRNEPY